MKIIFPTAEREIRLSRLLNASIALVWEVWTNPENIKHWWRPNGFTNTITKMDVTGNGEWDLIMHGPDGTDYKNKSIFKEMIKHKKLTYKHVSTPKFLATVEFEEQGEKTLLNWHMLFGSKEQFIQVVKTFKADEGLKQNTDKLECIWRKDMPVTNYLSPASSMPKELVFKAWKDVKMLAKWWGPNDFTCPICEIDATPGGKIYIDMKGPDGNVYPMDGEFHEIIAPEKVVFTSAALDENNQRLFEVKNIVTLTEENGKTKLTLQVKVSNIKSQGAHHLTGMNEGWSKGIKRLTNLVE